MNRKELLLRLISACRSPIFTDEERAVWAWLFAQHQPRDAAFAAIAAALDDRQLATLARSARLALENMSDLILGLGIPGDLTEGRYVDRDFLGA